MRGWIVKAFLAALAVHAVVLLFGGLVLFRSDKKAVVRENVEIVAEQAEDKKVDKKEPEPKKAQEAPIEESDEPMPDVRDLAQLEAPMAAPALAALSLADLEGVLTRIAEIVATPHPAPRLRSSPPSPAGGEGEGRVQ